jgi:hypothetical protein
VKPTIIKDNIFKFIVSLANIVNENMSIMPIKHQNYGKNKNKTAEGNEQ